MADEGAHGTPRATCPTCGVPAPWHGNLARPFCSTTCQLIDLGTWLDERYRMPSDEAHDAGARGARSTDAPGLERPGE